jgi:hypothetical protein
MGMGLYMNMYIETLIVQKIDEMYNSIGGEKNYKKLSKEQKKEFDERMMFSIGKAALIAYFNMSTDVMSSYTKRLGGVLGSGSNLGSMAGKTVGGVVPLNALQQEIANAINQKSVRGDNFVTNALTQISMMPLNELGDVQVDWRGREYKKSDIYASNLGGIMAMFDKHDKTDELDYIFANAELSVRLAPFYVKNIDKNGVTRKGLPLTEKEILKYNNEVGKELNKLLLMNKADIKIKYKNKDYEGIKDLVSKKKKEAQEKVKNYLNLDR